MRHKWGPPVETKMALKPHYTLPGIIRESVCATCGLAKQLLFINYQYVKTYWKINDQLFASRRTPECQRIPQQLKLDGVLNPLSNSPSS